MVQHRGIKLFVNTMVRKIGVQFILLYVWIWNFQFTIQKRYRYKIHLFVSTNKKDIDTCCRCICNKLYCFTLHFNIQQYKYRPFKYPNIKPPRRNRHLVC